MKHVAEYQPTWRDIHKYPPPRNAKILLRLPHGTAIIGTYYEESKATHWCGLPRFADQDNNS